MTTNDISPAKRALMELRQMRAQLDELEAARSEPIAIIGMGMRFPGGVQTADDYWELLSNGVDAIRTVPADRWNVDAYYDADPQAPGKMTTRAGGFLDHIDEFDAAFFNISPREAQSMDPQQRLLLQVAWEALENAGVAPDKLTASATGVFVGVGNSDYSRMVWSDADQIDVYSATGTSYAVASGRLSYLLGLQGPSLTVDTACSSSLVAIHLAVQSLRSAESKLALAAGVNLILTPEAHINFSKAGMMAADDHCKTFDARADGYVRGEGVGVVVLKRLSDAQANGDRILGLIRGAAVNQDGRSAGLTAPNGPSQEAVIRAALANAGVSPAEVGYVEAHGTGTPLGDPIEVGALAAVLAEGHSAADPLLIGSAKTNLGHLEAAAGVAGLIKAVLMLQHGEIAPHLHFQTPSPYIPWDSIPVQVATRRMPLAERNGRRIIGVSSFGFSGTNAHVILESAPQAEIATAEAERPLHVLTLSARQPEALLELTQRFEQELNTADLADVSFTANTGRAHLPHRLALVAESAADAQAKLRAFAASEDHPDVHYTHTLQAPEVVFLFTGHGAQYVGMGRTLYQTNQVFRQALDQCAEIMRGYLERPLQEVLFDETGLMQQMVYSQPALFALQYALAQTWASWGIRPTVVMGHSVGEYAAACIAGLFSLEDGLKLVYTRGRLFDTLQPGQMVTVYADEARVAAAVAPYADRVALAVLNGQTNQVISGAIDAVEAIVATLNAEGIKTKKIDVPQAAHSPLLDPVLAEFERVAGEIQYQPLQIGFVSGVSGKLASTSEVGNAAYWRRHLRQPVRFAAVMETLREAGYHAFVEIGPHPVLLSITSRNWNDGYGLLLPSLREKQSDWVEILNSLAELHVNGVEVDWAGFDREYPRRRLALPTYPWARERYWITPAAKQTVQPTDAGAVWRGALEAGQHQSGMVSLDLPLASYPARWQLLDQLTQAVIIDTLRKLNIFSRAGETHTIESLLAQGGINASYGHLLTRWLNRLVQNGVIEQRDATFVSHQPLPDSDLPRLWAETVNALSDTPELIGYLERCQQQMVAILRGTYSPLETLFPGGSYATTEFLYHKWGLAQYFNNIVRALLQNAASRITNDLRVLEIGAGTGGTSLAVLPIFPPQRTTYVYTDLSDFFLGHAQEKFRDYPFVRYGLLNIEQDPQEQGYTANSFDFVIAANALHATRDLHQTLTHVRSLLAPGGLLVLYEATNPLGWYDITTGLIEGWGLFEDELRGDSPLLPAETWHEVLLADGFEQVSVFPHAGAATEILAHNIIVAQVTQTGQRNYDDYSGQAAPVEVQPGASAVEVLVQDLALMLPDDRHEYIYEFVREKIARLLRLASPQALDRRSRLMDIGVDSLMAIELRNKLESSLGVSLPATLIFDYPTIESVVSYLETLLFAPADLPAAPQVDDSAAEIDQLSDDEVTALLLKKLGNL